MIPTSFSCLPLQVSQLGTQPSHKSLTQNLTEMMKFPPNHQSSTVINLACVLFWELAICLIIVSWTEVAVSLFRANAMEPTLEYSIYGVVIWLVVAPSFLQYFLWLAKTFPATRTPCSPRDVLVTLLMIALALPPVLMVCSLVSFQKTSDFKGKVRNYYRWWKKSQTTTWDGAKTLQIMG